MSVRMHETNVGNRLPPVCNMPATGMQHVRRDSDVRLWRCRFMIDVNRRGQPVKSPSAVRCRSSAALAMSAMWGRMYATIGEAAEAEAAAAAAAMRPGQPWTPPTLAGPPGPVTPPSLLPMVDPNRQFGGGRPLVWPRQAGEVARQSPHELLSGHGKSVKLMQDMFEEVRRLMVQTDLHLEAAMGRNVGNTLCPYPDNLPGAVQNMAGTFKVPYSL